MISATTLNPRIRNVVAAVSGALLAAAFAPLGWWPLAIICPAVLMWLWQGVSPREAAWHGFWFNIGTFGVGTYWLFTAIHIFGPAPIWLAALVSGGLVVIMSLYHALLGYVAARWLPATGPQRWLIGLPALWLLIEWLRGWFLSGFMWLSLGYSQTDTWLAAFAPVLGVYGISALLLVSAGALLGIALGSVRTRITAGALLIAPWIAGGILNGVEWTRPAGQPVGVAIVQGAISQDQKWLKENRASTLRLYRDLTRSVLGVPLIVWPESAIPDAANNVVDYLRELYGEARLKGSDIVMGIVRVSEEQKYYNSVLSLSDTVGWYDKHHLVPFAEFFPVPQFVRDWLRLMSLPYSDFTRGLGEQPPLKAAGLSLAATVCYEDGYGSSQLHSLYTSDVLVNVTNDAWFGDSAARHQHLQIARMRSIESGRFMLRAAQDGVSAVIGPHGEIIARAPDQKPYVLRASVTPRTGLPPYAKVGNWLIVSLAAVALSLSLAWQRLVQWQGALRRPVTAQAR